jgi:TetR/AcrR family transcriptional regulator
MSPRARPALAGRRAQILDTAGRAFADKGFEGVRLHEIARQAELNQATMLYYFPSKRAIYRACLGYAVEQLSEAFAEGYFEADGQNGAVRVVGALLDLFERQPWLGRLIRQASLSGGGDFDEVFLKPLRPFYRRGVRALQRAMAEGNIRKQDAEELVLMLYGAILIYLTEDPLVAGLSGKDPRSPANRKRHRDFVMNIASRLLIPTDGTAPKKARAKRSGVTSS